SARCPFHEDTHPSFSIWKNGDGHWTWKCHAGCGAGDEINFLESHEKLSPRDALKRYLELSGIHSGAPAATPSPGRRHSSNNQKPQPTAGIKRVVATYDHIDPETGKLLFQCVRYEPKNFKQRRPDPQWPGEWIWNLDGVRRVLYRALEVEAAKVFNKTVQVVEGEKDCEELVKHGLVATCNPCGAGKWLPEY